MTVLEKDTILSKVAPYTCLSPARLEALYHHIQRVNYEGLFGCMVECGVFKGGSAGLMALSAPLRPLWLFDSCQGLPEPKEWDIDCGGQRGSKGSCTASKASLIQNLSTMGIVAGKGVYLLEGWFSDTLLEAAPGITSIAVLHLDCDWYASVKLCLELLYDKVVPGGYVQIDDYGHWLGCKKAVDEFFKGRDVELIPIDYTGVGICKKL